ncbi:MAG TPA: hypothetical protein PLV72_01130 [Candidatus Magasanikbacteria bacterium]|nr:hypothetical protein [Candidatus Magasanikbacteria bacterium]
MDNRRKTNGESVEPLFDFGGKGRARDNTKGGGKGKDDEGSVKSDRSDREKNPKEKKQKVKNPLPVFEADNSVVFSEDEDVLTNFFSRLETPDGLEKFVEEVVVEVTARYTESIRIGDDNVTNAGVLGEALSKTKPKESSLVTKSEETPSIEPVLNAEAVAEKPVKVDSPVEKVKPKVAERREFLPSQMEFYENLATRESLDSPDVFSKLIREVGVMMDREEAGRRKSIVELSENKPVLVISALNGNREALVKFLTQKPIESHSVDGLSGSYFDLLKQDKINIVFGGNYTHRAGSEAVVERQRAANLAVDGDKDYLSTGEMLDNEYQNSVMSDALNSLQLIFNLKKQFPKNVTLLAGRYELLIDGWKRDIDTKLDENTNEDIAYVEWLKSYFGPKEDVVREDVDAMSFAKLRFPVGARRGDMIFMPALPNSFRGVDRRVTSPVEVIRALEVAEPDAVASMGENEKIDPKRASEYARLLGVGDRESIWILTCGGIFPDSQLGGDEDSFQTRVGENVQVYRLNNYPNSVSGFFCAEKSVEEGVEMFADYATAKSPVREKVPRSKLSA